VSMWGTRRWDVALAGTMVIALAIALPTELIPNPVFDRMTPTIWWNYPVWFATAALSGLLLATYVRDDPVADRPSRRGGLGGLLAFLAVGCPVCNKLVVVALGTLRCDDVVRPAATGAGDRGCRTPGRRAPWPPPRRACLRDPGGRGRAGSGWERVAAWPGNRTWLRPASEGRRAPFTLIEQL
jgi:hypothetical protein